MIKIIVPGLFALLLTGCLAASPTEPKPGSPAAAEDSSFRYTPLAADDASRNLANYLKGRLAAKMGDLAGAEEFLRAAAQSDRDQAALLIDLAHLYLRQGKIEEAGRAAEDALVLNPDLVLGHRLLGDILLRTGKVAKSIPHFEKALTLDPTLEDAAINLAIANARNGDSEKATEVLKELLDRRPDSLNGRLTLARIYREIGLTVFAEEAFRDLISRYPELDSAYFELGAMLEKEGKANQAQEVYRQGLARNPDAGQLRHLLVSSLVREGRLNDAREELRILIDDNPEDLEAYRKLGLIALEQGNWPAAEEAFRRILQDEPEQDQIRYYLGTALEQQERWAAAIASFGAVQENSSLYGEALVHLSYLHQRLGEGERARQLLEQAIAHDSERPQYYLYLAGLLDEQGAFAEAIEVLEEGRDKAEITTEFTYRIGILLGKLERWDEAVAAMRQVVAQDPDHADALNYIAYHFAETGRNLDEALELARRALELKEVGYIRDTLGWVHFQRGEYREALAQLAKAAVALPDDPVVQEHLGDALQALGKREQARAAYRRSLAINPEAGGVRDKLEKLEGR